MIAGIGDVVTYTGNFYLARSIILRDIMKEYLREGYEYEVLGVNYGCYRIHPHNIKTGYDKVWFPQKSFRIGRSKEFYKSKYMLR